MTETENQDGKSILEIISDTSSFLEKLGIARRMQKAAYPFQEVKYVTGLEDFQIKYSPKEYKKTKSAIEEVIQKGFWDNKLTKAFLRVNTKKADDNETENSLREIFDRTKKVAQKETYHF